MAYRYAVLGAGMQGVAAAYDLAKFGQAEQVLIVDIDLRRAEEGAARVNRLLGGEEELIQPRQLDVQDREGLVELLRKVDVALSAVPYHFNLEITKAAIAARAGLCDLGGNTKLVLEQLKLNSEAEAAGVTVIPDCGLAPGLSTILAVYAISQMERPREVHIRCGGLPQRPLPPLGYKLVFSIEGLTNEYLERAYLLRGGRIVEVESLTELEELEFPPPVGRCEAFITSGGTSTCPWTFAGKLEEFDYKTVRYPGHCEKFRVLCELGLLEPEPVQVGECQVAPRALFHKVAAPRLAFPEEPDLVVLRVICRGEDASGSVEVQLDLMDFYDETTGFSAMARTTGFSAAIVAAMIAQGKLREEKGVIPLERAVSPKPFLAELARRGFELAERVTRMLSLSC